MREQTFGENLRSFARKLAITVGTPLGTLRRLIPFRTQIKRALGFAPSPQTANLREPPSRLAFFVEVRSLGGGLSDEGVDWIFDAADGWKTAVCFASSRAGEQVATALQLRGVSVAERDRTSLAHALRQFDAVIVPREMLPLAWRLAGTVSAERIIFSVPEGESATLVADFYPLYVFGDVAVHRLASAATENAGRDARIVAQ